MSRYTPVPAQTSEEEMEAAFDNSDDEDDEDETHDTSRPLLSAHAPQSHPLEPSSDSDYHSPSHSRSNSMPGGYDFEYDYAMMPPPGSPPRPSSLALPNAYGNSNGLVPTASAVPLAAPRQSILRRAMGAILPTHYARDRHGGGLGNDGVFGNVVAKPGGPEPVRGAAGAEGSYWVPEETQKEPPPTYQSAQADSVPPYWENTILAPSGPLDGDMVIDSLPVGSVFAFLWNLLVSVSFQFVGFLLTYLLHTTHASKFGSRAGLGITLIQYGFYMRSPEVSVPVADDDGWNNWAGPPEPSQDGTNPVSTVVRLVARALAMPPLPGLNDTSAAPLPNDPGPGGQLYGSLVGGTLSTNDWLSFLLMTIGWFVLITSLLGFWRVKRWERGIQRSVLVDREPTPEEIVRDAQVMRNLEQAFGFGGFRSAADAGRQDGDGEESGERRNTGNRFQFL